MLTYIHSEAAMLAGDGLLKKVSSWRSYLSEVGLVLCDEPGFGKFASALRGNGRPVLGCDPIADQIELSIPKQLQLFESLSIPYPDTDFWFSDDRSTLPSFRESFIRIQGAFADHFSFLVQSQREWEYVLSTVNGSSTLIIQDVANGTECSVMGLWNGRAFLEPFFLIFDKRRPSVGDLGPVTDCAGLVMRPVGASSRLVKETLAKLEPFLKVTAYRGMVSIRCTVADGGLLALGLKCGFSYDAADALGASLHEDNLGDAFFDCAIGVCRKLRTTDDFVACTRLTCPPWPYDDPITSMRGLPLRGLDEKTLPYVNLCDIYMLSGGPAYAAGTGVPAKVLAFGRSADEAGKRVLRTLQNVRIMGGQYRTDIADGVGERFSRMKAAGWV